jgi:type III pantothenate kinase
MADSALFPLIAVDIGNNRIKLGRFETDWQEPLPAPCDTLEISAAQPTLDAIAPWLGQCASRQAHWWIGSVNRSSTTRLLNWLRIHRPADPVTFLASGDLPLVVHLERPDMVGIDRLLDAMGVNRLRDPQRPAVIVDVGSAITVDLVSREGAFLGGAILPGIAMSARAMHEFTDLLPLIEMTELTAPPPALGKATLPAMRSGLFWGAVGAVRQLIERLTLDAGAEPQVFLSGGASPAVASLLDRSVQHVPHLTLGSIALTAQAQSRA